MTVTPRRFRAQALLSERTADGRSLFQLMVVRRYDGTNAMAASGTPWRAERSCSVTIDRDVFR
jgi:hypothetical protein